MSALKTAAAVMFALLFVGVVLAGVAGTVSLGMLVAGQYGPAAAIATGFVCVGLIFAAVVLYVERFG